MEEILKQLLEEQRTTNRHLEFIRENGVGTYIMLPPLMDMEGLAQHINIPVPTAYVITNEKKIEIPYIQIGKHKRFCPLQLKDHFDRVRKKTVNEIREEKLKNSKTTKRNVAETVTPDAPCSRKVHKKLTKPKNMAQHYGELLKKQKWDFFCTFTTSHYMSKGKSAANINELFHVLSNDCKVSIFWLSEKFPDGRGYHLHCLVKFHDDGGKADQRRKTINTWADVSGNGIKKSKKINGLTGASGNGIKKRMFQKVDVQQYEEAKNGCFYLSNKLKDEDVEYDFLGMQHFPENLNHDNENIAA